MAGKTTIEIKVEKKKFDVSVFSDDVKIDDVEIDCNGGDYSMSVFPSKETLKARSRMKDALMLLCIVIGVTGLASFVAGWVYSEAGSFTRYLYNVSVLGACVAGMMYAKERDY